MIDQLTIEVDDLQSRQIIAFLEAHLDDMRSVTPPGSKHALDLDGLRAPDVTFWSGSMHGELVACGAVKVLTPNHGELKSMRVRPLHRGAGLGSAMVQHAVTHAAQAGLRRLSLETGSFAFFAPARRLYERHGFTYCEPFADYDLDPNSVFMTRPIDPQDHPTTG